jgi:opacity protein-like surface antigen
MQLKRVLFAVVLGGLMLLIPAQARADWIFTPFIGANLHNEDDTLGLDTKNGTVNFGGSLAWMGAGVFGVELDFGYAPNFFEQQNTSAFDGNVTTLMGNLILGIPIGGQTGGGVRPYVSGGVGLIKSRLDDVEDFFDIDESSFGINAGGGVMIFFTDSVGIRGDLRYFRSFRNIDENDLDLSLGGFDFWRASAGVSFRF